MTIGIDARPLQGVRTGVGRYLLNLLEQWGCTSEHRFILYFKNNAPLLGVLERPCYIKKILRSPLGLESNFLFQHFLLPAAAKKDKVDVLFSPSYILPWNWLKKCIVAIHDVSYEVYPEQISLANKFLLSRASWRSAQIASRILTVTEFSKQEIVKFYKAAQNKIIVTPLGVDEKFQPIKDDKKIDLVKKKYKLSGDYIIWMGSIFRRRHIPQVIAGFFRVAKKFKNLELLIIGKNYTYPFIDIEKLISDVNDKLNREAIIHFDHARDDDLLWLYNGAKLLVYLSDYEGFGLPPLEAARCGVPAIVSNIPVEKEVMDEAAVFIDDNNNTGEIADKIEKVLIDEELRNDIIKKGLERVKKFSWKKCAEKTLEVITEIN